MRNRNIHTGGMESIGETWAARRAFERPPPRERGESLAPRTSIPRGPTSSGVAVSIPGITGSAPSSRSRSAPSEHSSGVPSGHSSSHAAAAVLLAGRRSLQLPAFAATEQSAAVAIWFRSRRLSPLTSLLALLRCQICCQSVRFAASVGEAGTVGRPPSPRGGCLLQAVTDTLCAGSLALLVC